MIKQLLKYYLYMVSIFFIGRLGLFILYFDHFSHISENYWMTFIYGLRMDTITASVLLIIPTLILALTPNMFKNFANTLLKYYMLLVLVLAIYIENATFPFIAQYDVRPNYLFVAYLEYPKEVFSMIFAAYKLELSIAFIMIASFIYFYIKRTKGKMTKAFETPYWIRFLLIFPVAILLFIGIRSSFGHRGANPSDAMYTGNRMVNEITKNSLHNIIYAVYASKKNDSKDIQKRYGHMDIKEAISRVQKRLNISPDDKKLPFTRLVKSHFKRENPKNLVIFLQESLGYQFVHAVGGEAGITPNLNRLAKDGILFTDMHSNGTRSIRGLAGTSAGNLAIPGKGVLKRNKSQNDFYTFAASLKPLGYHTSFMYGGEARFDNMKSWFLGNGFDEVIEQKDFKNPTFTAPWGVCDEDLVVRANNEFKKLYHEHKKFATIMFSQSNHSPFEYPDNKIKLIDGQDAQSVKNAVKYADYAIGKFIDLAKKEGYYKDTIILVVADHNVRVYGKDMVPVDMFHIPALILGGDVKPMVYSGISTQPDALATVLDLLGVDLKYPIMGHSVFSDKKQNISLMQFNESYALRVDNKVAIIRPNKKPITFTYSDPTKFDDRSNHLKEVPHDKELEKDVLAFVITLNYLYNNKLYK